eukprot:1137426-Pelagomonas_calceolata.AAC.2
MEKSSKEALKGTNEHSILFLPFDKIPRGGSPLLGLPAAKSQKRLDVPGPNFVSVKVLILLVLGRPGVHDIWPDQDQAGLFDNYIYTPTLKTMFACSECAGCFQGSACEEGAVLL